MSESSRRARFERARQAARAALPAVVSTTIRIAETAAPTGAERDRAQLVKSLLAERGYAAEVDEIGNVYVRHGRAEGKAVLLAAHTDIVFPATTDLSVTREDDVLRGPGVGDNSLGVAAMLATLDELGPDVNVIATADVGEEGLGNLAGIRAAVERYRSEIGAVIAIEGHNLGRVTHAAVGSRRWKLSVRGQGGHSWGAFGQPSAIHGLARIVAAISGLSVSAEPKTTFNVGVISGGTTVNTIAASASALLDMRSIDPAALDDLARRVKDLTQSELDAGLEVAIEELGERPAGSIPLDNPLIVAAGEAVRLLGSEPVFDASSTDANIPISLGIPSVCVGVTRGGLGHTVDEYVHIAPIAEGLAQLIWLTETAAELVKSAGNGRA